MSNTFNHLRAVFSSRKIPASNAPIPLPLRLLPATTHDCSVAALHPSIYALGVYGVSRGDVRFLVFFVHTLIRACGGGSDARKSAVAAQAETRALLAGGSGVLSIGTIFLGLPCPGPSKKIESQPSARRICSSIRFSILTRLVMRKRTFRRFSPRCDVLEARRLLLGYTPAQITAAYALNAISFMSPSGTAVTGNGAGQTIALIETYHDPNIQASLDGFDARYGLPNITLDVVNLAGNQTDGGWAGEESLDVEWAHAIAPGANIEVVEAAPGNNDAQSFSDFITAVQTASQTKGVSVVSMSLGSSEFSGESSSDAAFLTAGITYVASSGDGGTVEWPASAPDVLAVGGTTLRVSGAGYGSELGWAGTGGGLAVDETEPSYQEGAQSTGQRSTPDVSFEADPSTGVSVYYVPPNGTGDAGNWGIVGGTSVGARPGPGFWRSPTRAVLLGGSRRSPAARRQCRRSTRLLRATFARFP